MQLVEALLVSKAAPDQDFHLFLSACFAPAHDFRNRSITTQADIVLVKTAITNTWRLHAVDGFAGIISHQGYTR